ncbi:flagellar protein FlaJ [Methanohalophilus levihalophilus]|uniref:type II secretion system F family protein n=1 Tax=Methanohalophilus levihalophilus TaxID=1431282 RepID=UPI001AE67FCF|nr:type II secretion system F family protein [Methanohalophilus levihalophilus]MBP2031152.1 flagellar protein FlaJ [Methanohalophilus levihalophilus]
MDFLTNISYKLFGTYIRDHRHSYDSLEILLRSARIPVPVEQYASLAYFMSLIIGLLLCLFSSTVAKLILYGNSNVPANLQLWVAILISLFFLFGGILATHFLIMRYPSIISATRTAYLDISLNHSVSYLYALSRGGGMNLMEMMRSLSKQQHVYGVSAEEFGYIIRDVEYFGMDLIGALKNASIISPSEKFKNLVDGLISVVASGGDLTAYLRSKSEQYRLIAAREQKAFLETLGILAEIYITVFVVGPVFLMTILVVLGFLGSDSLSVLYTLVYVMIPIGTILFVVFLSTISDELISPKMYILSEVLDEFDDVKVIPANASDMEILKEISRQYRISNIKSKLLNPFDLLRNNPRYSFYVTVPIASLYLLYSLWGFRDILLQLNFSSLQLQSLNIEVASMIDDYVIFSFLIIATPFIVFYETHAYWLRKVENELPDFLKRLASINEAGILLVDAISLVSRSKIGVLHSEVKRMVEHISWGSNLVEVLRKFEYRIRTDLNSRIITLIIKASESTSDVISVLNIASSEADLENQLKKERASEMLVYVFIVYISFFVFLFIVYVLAAFFLPALPTGAEDAGSGMPINFGFNMDAFTLLFFHATLIQGFCSGLVAGKMGSGSISAGVKHSVIMVLSAYFVFTQFL